MMTSSNGNIFRVTGHLCGEFHSSVMMTSSNGNIFRVTGHLSGEFHSSVMMTSSNGNIFRVTGHLCGEFTGPVTRSFDVFFDLRLNKRLSKQSWCWWFETLSRPLWCHCNGERADMTTVVYMTFADSDKMFKFWGLQLLLVNNLNTHNIFLDRRC